MGTETCFMTVVGTETCFMRGTGGDKDLFYERYWWGPRLVLREVLVGTDT